MPLARLPGALVVFALAGTAAAQPGTLPAPQLSHPDKPAVLTPQVPTKTTVTAQPPYQPPTQGPGTNTIPYETLVEKDSAGHVLRISGCLDALALLRNPIIDDKTRQTMMPAVAEWTADINQLAIDNLDFLERIDDGFIEGFENGDMAKAKIITNMFTQLTSTGPLAARLQQRTAITIQQYQLNQQIANEYVTAVASELSPPGPRTDMVEQTRIQNALSRFYYSLNSRDAVSQYHRQVIDSAALLDKIIPDLKLPADVTMRIGPKAAAVKAAKTEYDKLTTGLSMLKELSFDQRRAYLAAAVALGAAADPFHPPPPLPVVTPPPSATAPAASPAKPQATKQTSGG